MASSEPSSTHGRNPSFEDNSLVLRLNDTSLDIPGLASVNWQECSKIIIHIDPPFDSPDPTLPHLIDYINGANYMAVLLDRSKLASSVLKTVLEDSINAGQMEIQLVFGEC